MTNSFSEFKKAKLFFVIGSNMTEAHPVAATYVKNALVKGAKLIVADPRKHQLAKMADMYIPLTVGSDVAFLNSLMHVIIKENLYDKDFIENHTVDFETIEEAIKAYPPDIAAPICKISADQITETARFLASIKPAMLCYTLGITEHTCGTDNVKSIANLQMLLGNLGVECGGVNPLRGQNNVQGACDMGALPNVYHGYQKVVDETGRKKFEKAWHVDKLPDQMGMMIPEMMDSLVSNVVSCFVCSGRNIFLLLRSVILCLCKGLHTTSLFDSFFTVRMILLSDFI